jgi:hypothetical protein
VHAFVGDEVVHADKVSNLSQKIQLSTATRRMSALQSQLFIP